MNKILFLDVDGVLNTARTIAYQNTALALDPYMVLLVDRIVQATGCKVVLSSSWRYEEQASALVMKAVPFIDTTPKNQGLTSRGTEIKEWLSKHPEVEKYAILDDATDFLDDQKPNFFRTFWEKGLTEEIADKVIKHLKGDE